MTSQEEHQAHNLRYLLWNRGVNRGNWVKELARLLKCDIRKSENILRGVSLNPEQIMELSKAFSISDEELVYGNLVEKVNIPQENIKFLLNTLAHGERKKLASELSVDITTISRWGTGKNPPDSGNLSRLSNYFQISPSLDITRTPLFLELDPITDPEKKHWIEVAVNKLDRKTLNELFPALKKLLGD